MKDNCKIWTSHSELEFRRKVHHTVAPFSISVEIHTDPFDHLLICDNPVSDDNVISANTSKLWLLGLWCVSDCICNSPYNNSSNWGLFLVLGVTSNFPQWDQRSGSDADTVLLELLLLQIHCLAQGHFTRADVHSHRALDAVIPSSQHHLVCVICFTVC